MKYLLVLAMLVSGNSFAKNKPTHKIILEFKNNKDKDKWLVWYLDQGGEEASGFIVDDWTDNTFQLQDDAPSTIYPYRCQIENRRK